MIKHFLTWLDPEEKTLIAELLGQKPFFYLVGFCTVWSFITFPLSTAFAATVLATILLMLALIDFKHMILPDALIFPGAILGVLLSPLTGLGIGFSLIGGAFGFALFFSLFWIFYKIKGQPAMGFGDVKFMLLIGTWVGPLDLPLVLIIASFTGLFVFVARFLLRNVSGNVPIPFGPLLAAGTWLVFLYSASIWPLLQL